MHHVAEKWLSGRLAFTALCKWLTDEACAASGPHFLRGRFDFRLLMLSGEIWENPIPLREKYSKEKKCILFISNSVEKYLIYPKWKFDVAAYVFKYLQRLVLGCEGSPVAVTLTMNLKMSLTEDWCCTMASWLSLQLNTRAAETVFHCKTSWMTFWQVLLIHFICFCHTSLNLRLVVWLEFDQRDVGLNPCPLHCKTTKS